MSDNSIQWHREKLKLALEELAAFEAPYAGSDSADGNAFIVEMRRRVALLEKLIAECEKQNAPEH
jgi:hypothetical protein